MRLPRRLHAPGSLVRRRVAESGRERGAAIVMVVVWLPILVLIAAFVVDIANWFVHRRHLQMQADAAALAAAGDWAFPGCSDAAIEARARRVRRLHLELADRRYAGQPGASAHELPYLARPDLAGRLDGRHRRPVRGRDGRREADRDRPALVPQGREDRAVHQRPRSRLDLPGRHHLRRAPRGGSRPAPGARPGGVRRRERLHPQRLPRARAPRPAASGWRRLVALGQLGRSAASHRAVEQDRSPPGAE